MRVIDSQLVVQGRLAMSLAGALTACSGAGAWLVL